MQVHGFHINSSVNRSNMINHVSTRKGRNSNPHMDVSNIKCPWTSSMNFHFPPNNSSTSSCSYKSYLGQTKVSKITSSSWSNWVRIPTSPSKKKWKIKMVGLLDFSSHIEKLQWYRYLPFLDASTHHTLQRPSSNALAGLSLQGSVDFSQQRSATVLVQGGHWMYYMIWSCTIWCKYDMFAIVVFQSDIFHHLGI